MAKKETYIKENGVTDLELSGIIGKTTYREVVKYENKKYVKQTFEFTTMGSDVIKKGKALLETNDEALEFIEGTYFKDKKIQKKEYKNGSIKYDFTFNKLVNPFTSTIEELLGK